MSVRPIFVSGLSGAGKATFVAESRKVVDNLEVMITFTTQPIRYNEVDSYEYIFVSESEYEELKDKSKKWDETVYANNKYASDAEEYIKSTRA